MKFLNFFKKSKKKEEKISKEIKLNDINNWILENQKKIKIKEKEALDLIKNKNTSFKNEIREDLEKLDRMDLNSKEAPERVKKIVKQNYLRYVSQIKKLVEDVDKIKSDSFEDYIKKINSLFITFEKNSYNNYHRASYLFNKELNPVRKKLVDLSEYISEILEDNKNIIRKILFIENLKEKIKELDETKKNINDLDEKIKEHKEKLIFTNKNKEQIENAIDHEEIKKTKNKIKEIENREDELKKDICTLKEMIDFKKLGNIYHVDKEKIKEIKNLKERFEEEYLRDNGENILKFIEDAKIDSLKIKEKINQINKEKKEIKEEKEKIKPNTEEEQLKEIIKDIKVLEKELEDEIEKSKKIKIYKEEIISEIEKELLKVNIVLIKKEKD